MKIFRLLSAAFLLGVCAACAHHGQPRSSTSMVMDGDRNSSFHPGVSRAGETVRTEPR